MSRAILYFQSSLFSPSLFVLSLRFVSRASSASLDDASCTNASSPGSPISPIGIPPSPLSIPYRLLAFPRSGLGFCSRLAVHSLLSLSPLHTLRYSLRTLLSTITTPRNVCLHLPTRRISQYTYIVHRHLWLQCLSFHTYRIFWSAPLLPLVPLFVVSTGCISVA